MGTPSEPIARQSTTADGRGPEPEPEQHGNDQQGSGQGVSPKDGAEPKAVEPAGAKPKAAEPATAKQETGKQETGKQETGKQETGKQETDKLETGKQEASDREAGEPETPEQEAGGPGSGQPEAGQPAGADAQTVQQEGTVAPTPAQGETPTEQAPAVEPAVDPATEEVAPKELASAEPRAAAVEPTLSLVDLHARLEGRTGPEFESFTREMLRDHPESGRDAILLRAGSEVPPGLTAAVTARRTSMREEARRLIHTDLASAGEQPCIWVTRLNILLDGRALDPDLRCAAFSVVADLKLYSLTDALARGLEPDVRGRSRHAARKALFQLYRRWFDRPEELREYRAGLPNGVPPPELIAQLEAAQTRANDLMVRLVSSKPEVAGEALSDPSPAVRAAAARSLLESVSKTQVSSDRARALLFDGFASEPDASAFRARLDALVELCASEQAKGDGISRLRSILSSLDADPSIAWSVLHGLAHLRWDESPEASGESSLQHGVSHISELFSRLVDPERVLDADLLRQGLADLRSISGRTRPEISAPAREAVFFLLREYAGATDVRRAAASSAAVVLAPTDVDALVDLLETVKEEALVRNELLGTLGILTAHVSPTSASARRVLALLVAHLDETEVDLRRRALTVLSSPDMEGLVTAAGDPLLVDALAQRLHEEADHDLWVADFQLLSRFPRPDLVETVLGSSLFTQLVTGNELERVTGILAKLAGSDPAQVYRCARHLLGIEHGTTRVARLERAIGLVAGLPPEAAARMTPAEHASVVSWVLELRKANGSRAGGPPGLASFLPTLVNVHLAGLADEPLPNGQSLAHARAIFAADQWLITQKNETSSVLRLFAAALEQVGSDTGERYLAILRDRARFEEQAQLLPNALADFTVLLSKSSERDLADLRSAARLLVNPKANPKDDPKQAQVRAFHLTSELIDRSLWLRERPADRLQDLRDLTARALATGDVVHRARVHGLLDDLPPLPETGSYQNGSDASANNAKWSGLLANRTWHEALLDLQAQVGQNSPAPAAATPPAGKPAGSGEGKAGSSPSRRG